MGNMKNQSAETQAAAWDWLEDVAMQHPEYGRDLKRTLKKIDGRVNFPEVDNEDRYEAKAKEQTEKIDAFIKEQKDKENKSYWEGERKKARDAGYLTSEEQKEFEDWMIGEHLGNYQRAAKMWHDEKHTPAAPTNYQDVTGIQLPNDVELFKNPNKWGRETAYKAINDLRRGRE